MFEENHRAVRVFAPCAFTWDNKGDAALLFALVQSLEGQLGSIDVVFTSFTPDYDSARYEKRFVEMPLAPHSLYSRAAHKLGHTLKWPVVAPLMVSVQIIGFLALMRLWITIYGRFGAAALVLLPRKPRAIVREITESDISVAMPGGYLMAPAHSSAHWMYHVAVLGLVKMMKKPLVLYPCSIGPFPGIHRGLASWFLKQPDMIMVRESQSQRCVYELSGGETTPMLVPDSAFLFDDDGRADGELESIFQKLRHLPKPWIGVSVRDHHFASSADPAEARESYLEAVVEVVETATQVLGASVIFVPQVRGYGGRDVLLSKAVLERVVHLEHVAVLDEDLSPQALKKLYASFEIMIGTRMHANILALTSGTPVVAVAYEHKTTGIMEMMGLLDFCVPIEKSEQELLSTVMSLWEQRDEIHGKVSIAVQQAQADAERSSELVKCMLQQLRR